MNSFAQSLTWIDYSVVALYILILVIIGKIVLSKKNKPAENETLFLAGNSLTWSNIGFNMWGTNVGPSMLLASASVGFSTGIVAANFAWYAFVFIFLLAMVFAPRYLAAKVTTMPEYMGKLYGDKTQNILAWYALVKILISWLSLSLFAGGVLVKQILGVPLWQSVIVMIAFSGTFAYLGGLRIIAKVNVFQMLLLIGVSLLLLVMGINKIDGLQNLWNGISAGNWNLFKASNDSAYPWQAIILGYPVMAVCFFCTDQSMVQSVLGAKNLEQGQKGVNFIGWLKILDVPLFIIPGIICFILYPHIKPDEAYMTMVTNIFPTGLRGLVIVVLMAVLIGTIGSSLNSLSTVFTMDIYAKKINTNATNKQLISVGRKAVLAGCVLAVGVAIAIDNIKGLNLFDVFQSILAFIAPPLSVIFLFAVFWKGTTRQAINFTILWGSVISLGTGVLYLWVFPKSVYHFWPHFLILSFYIFMFLAVTCFLISILGSRKIDASVNTISATQNLFKPSLQIKTLWAALVIIMVSLYIIFNNH